MTLVRAILVLLLFTGASVARAERGAETDTPDTTAWAGESPAESRLILESAQFAPHALIRAGVEIRLDRGWWTYWRAPGSSGMPPMFDWSGSENLADDPETIWPGPVRAVEHGESLNTYREQVVFPIEFRAKDPKRPVKLHLKLFYGTCRNVCMPRTAEHELVIKPTKGVPKQNTANAQLIAAFSGRSPSNDPSVTGVEIREVRSAVIGTNVNLWLRVAGVDGSRAVLVLVEGAHFERVGEVWPRNAINDTKWLRLKIGSARDWRFQPLDGRRVRITLIDGERALEQVWVVGTQGSSTVGAGVTPVARPGDKPGP